MTNTDVDSASVSVAHPIQQVSEGALSLMWLVLYAAMACGLDVELLDEEGLSLLQHRLCIWEQRRGSGGA